MPHGKCRMKNGKVVLGVTPRSSALPKTKKHFETDRIIFDD